MRLLTLFSLVSASFVSASDTYPPARFTDAQRVQKLESALSAVDALFQQYASAKKVPGLVWGVVIDNRLAHVASVGVRDRAPGAEVNADTVFRIASMTKSFTALAILKLRDDGKLGLEDRVSNWIPEFARMELPTQDTAPLTIRQLLSHSAGFPEDNPWGDQQLAATDDDLTRWLKQGIPFSTAPDTRYEYSNYAFGLLGRIVTKASGAPYDRYVKRAILDQLDMRSSTFDFGSVPKDRRAIGYRLQPDGAYLEEAPLPHGAFGSMGGLLTTATDLGKYVAFQLSAWPPRDDGDTGPVRRSSIREMNHLWRPANLTARYADGAIKASASGYGYGLRISSDCRFEQISAHGGGLPGFGSYMLWLPDYGVGMFAMANLTYSGPSEPIDQALNVLLKTGGLQRRQLPSSPVLTQARDRIFKLWNAWDDANAKQLAAMNLFLDKPVPERQDEIRKLKDEVGTCSMAGPVISENWLRGQFNITCERGTVGAFFTMAPTQPPSVQHLSFRKLSDQEQGMSAPTGAPSGVSCRE